MTKIKSFLHRVLLCTGSEQVEEWLPNDPRSVFWSHCELNTEQPKVNISSFPQEDKTLHATNGVRKQQIF